MRQNKIEKLTKAEMEFMEYIWTSEGKKTLLNGQTIHTCQTI